MSASVPSAAPRHLSPVQGLWPVIVVNALCGLPAYFILFLFAYGFRDEVGLAEHAASLVSVAIFATITGLVATAVSTAARRTRPLLTRAACGVQMSLALNSIVVAAGSIISATHKDKNSVSAGFSTTTDVLTFAGLVIVAVALGVAAVRSSMPPRRARRP